MSLGRTTRLHLGGAPDCPACWQVRQVRIPMKRTDAPGDDPFDFFVCLRCNFAMRDRRKRAKP